MANISSSSQAAFHAPARETRPVRFPTPAFLPVDSEEIAFALTLFVAAANRKLVYRPSRFFGLSLASRHACKDLFLALSDRDLDRMPSSPKTAISETSIQVAFMALWHHYEANASRPSICARVLGFYFLMERTGGAGLHRWIDPCPDHPEALLLHAEVVEAIAAVALDSDGQLCEPLFYKAIEDFEKAAADA